MHPTTSTGFLWKSIYLSSPEYLTYLKGEHCYRVYPYYTCTCIYLQCLTPPKCWCHSVFSFCGFVRGRPTFDLLISASVVSGGLVCGSMVMVDTTAGSSDVTGVRLLLLVLLETVVAWLSWAWSVSTGLLPTRGIELEERATGTLGEVDTCSQCIAQFNRVKWCDVEIIFSLLVTWAIEETVLSCPRVTLFWSSTCSWVSMKNIPYGLQNPCLHKIDVRARFFICAQLCGIDLSAPPAVVGWPPGRQSCWASRQVLMWEQMPHSGKVCHRQGRVARPSQPSERDRERSAAKEHLKESLDEHNSDVPDRGALFGENRRGGVGWWRPLPVLSHSNLMAYQRKLNPRKFRAVFTPSCWP